MGSVGPQMSENEPSISHFLLAQFFLNQPTLHIWVDYYNAMTDDENDGGKRGLVLVLFDRVWLARWKLPHNRL